ncbi:DUF3592 domain-containing protein [Arenicella xantha]|uniref:Uncharacterized protein DUF3592 n=1 Tax=Arenicella xantha TaxID=644221 RepID=A0A395JEH9_9GAMM|nr:DUF3592 domain-containing protein [Arenicella xantha]RBP47087.1 uncharacterized protein DUF3592 [Arenicella xantha]
MKGNWLGVLFFGIFAAAGIGIFLIQGVSMISQSMAAKSWVETPAVLSSHSLAQQRGEDSTTYQARAEYSYLFNGQTYHSDRVHWSTGYDNIGSYQQDMAERLAQISNQGGSFTVWVNPDQPSEAVIDRALRWSMLMFASAFLVMFGGVGVGGLVYTLMNWRSREPIQGASIEQPWQQYKEWNQPSRISNSKLGARAMLAFAVMWNAISSFALVMSIKAISDGDYLALIFLAFPAVGVLLVYLWYRMHRSYQRTGPMPLTMDPFPGSIGGQTGGHIVLSNSSMGRPQQSAVILQCVRRYRSGKHTQQTMIWQRRMIPAWQSTGSGLQASFCFDLDDEADLPISEAPGKIPGIAWRLQFEATLADGQEISREYVDLPVFRTGEKSSIRDPEAHQATSTASLVALDQRIKTVLDLVPVNGGHQLSYPAYTHWAGLVMGAIGLVFVVIGLLIPELVFNIVFPLIGGIVGLAGLAWFGSGLIVRIGPEGITSNRTLFGISLKPKFVPSYSFEELVERKSHSSTSGNKTTQYYTLVAHGRQGERADVARDLKSIEEVEAARKRLLEFMKF